MFCATTCSFGAGCEAGFGDGFDAAEVLCSNSFPSYFISSASGANAGDYSKSNFFISSVFPLIAFFTLGSYFSTIPSKTEIVFGYFLI